MEILWKHQLRDDVHHAFTLIELLVVISIISILAALLLPALKNARDRVNSLSCMNNEKNMALASLQYADDYTNYLPHSGYPHLGYNKFPNTCWRALIAPYLNVTVPPNSQNSYVLEHGVFQCPSQKKETCGNPVYGYNGFYGGYGWSYVYLGNSDGYSAPPYNSPHAPWTKTSQLKKPSQTIMLGDTPDDSPGSAADCFFFYCDAGPYTRYPARHNYGGNIAWADGHVSSHRRMEFVDPKNYIWWKLE